MTRALRVAIPNKGRLSEEAVRLLETAGVRLQSGSERRLFAGGLGGRIQVLFLRAQDIPEFVADGTVDCGLTGRDVVLESGAAVKVRGDLDFGHCRLVLAVPEASPWRRARDLPAGTRIATSFPRLTGAYFRRLGRRVRVVTVSGASEVTPMLGVADAITDLAASGSTLATHHLREVVTLLRSSCVLVTKPRVDREVAEEYGRLESALRSVVAAKGRRYLLADLPRKALKAAQGFLPGVAGPTVVALAGNPGWVAIQVVVGETDIYDAVHRLKGLGATGILVMPIERLVE